MEGGFLPEPETRAASSASWDPQPTSADQRSLQPPRAAGQAAPQPWGSAGRGGSAVPPGRFADGPPDNEGLLEAQGGCSRCPSLSFNSEWLRAFGVVLCNECKRSERLISKVHAGRREPARRLRAFVPRDAAGAGGCSACFCSALHAQPRRPAGPQP